MLRMIEGTCRGYFLVGENPAVGNANARVQRHALASLDWLVVRDTNEIESAAFWYDSPEIESGETRTEDIATEVFFLPAAAHTEKDGCFTNTQRLLQWREKAVEPPGRLPLGPAVDPRPRPAHPRASCGPRRTRATGRSSSSRGTTRPRARTASPRRTRCCRRSTAATRTARSWSKYQELKDDGSTTCGSWLHAGIYADGVNQAARRRPHTEQDWVAREWGWAWPADTRQLYNRASADPDGRPWSERKRYVWWDAAEGAWTGHDHPDFPPDKAPDFAPEPDATGMDAIRGTAPFIAHPDGLGWLWAPSGLVDGPVPTHYEPHESPFANPLYGQSDEPAAPDVPTTATTRTTRATARPGPRCSRTS